MLELEHRFRVVDVHAHLDVDTDGAGPGGGRADGPGAPGDRLERELRQAGVVRAVVFPGPREDGDYVAANNAVARHSVGRPFVPFARIAGPVDPDRLTGRGGPRLPDLPGLGGGPTGPGGDADGPDPEAIERYAYDDRFHGFALDPLSDGLPGPEALARLRELDSPVLVRAGPEFPPGAAVEALLDGPAAGRGERGSPPTGRRRGRGSPPTGRAGRGGGPPVVLAHFGGYPLDRSAMASAVDLLGEYDDLYLDTAAVRYRSVLERALREHPDRVLFGSGTPDVHPAVAVTELLTLDVPENTMERAFAGNAERVLPALAPGGD